MMHIEEKDNAPLSMGEEKNMVMQLLLLNITVFILLFFTEVLYRLEGNTLARYYDNVLLHVALPANITTLLHNPWSLITTMFVHNNFWMIVSNMIWLACFGTMLQHHAGRQRILPLYLLSGIVGAIFYLLGMQLIPSFRELQSFAFTCGAAPSVMALAIGATVVAPRYRLLPNLPIPFWIITVVFILVNIITHVVNSNDLTMVPALIGGGLTGFIYMQQWKKGNDLGAGFNRFSHKITHLFHPKTHLHIVK
ncbi:rhomboid family intramembrane serine protease [Chitinophaga ginsengisoli]|uniref:Membrane associated rhomboid family serine protease n=1 Tax=Chitinophaga ginsengisoli TaxID=363837 RepID=A0A2P8GNU1_9BACT|nr:rhomboid family intramembrane serine protease [Chitinophaga ginsengisoli]PSL35649.1 membrane associated rhomboid family serine protease [Chitinophaga ginsengisoli]